jgi:hypothetical protein
MNKILKIILICINIGMLIIAISWYFDNKEKEPLIVCGGQVAVLFGLLFEQRMSKIFTKDVYRSDVKIVRKPGDDVHTERIEDSKIDIQ